MIIREERLKLIEAREKSGLTISEWCEQSDFSKIKFYRLCQTERNYLKQKERKNAAISLLPVTVENESLEQKNFLKITAGKFQIEISENTDWNILKRTLCLLDSIC